MSAAEEETRFSLMEPAPSHRAAVQPPPPPTAEADATAPVASAAVAIDVAPAADVTA